MIDSPKPETSLTVQGQVFAGEAELTEGPGVDTVIEVPLRNTGFDDNSILAIGLCPEFEFPESESPQ